MFKEHSFSQRPNLRHLREPLAGNIYSEKQYVISLAARGSRRPAGSSVYFKKTTVGRYRYRGTMCKCNKYKWCEMLVNYKAAVYAVLFFQICRKLISWAFVGLFLEAA